MGIRLNITSQLTDRMNNSKEMAKAVEEAVKIFAGHDWGILLQEDSEANYRALESKTGHILARYGTPEGDIYKHRLCRGHRTNGIYYVLQ